MLVSSLRFRAPLMFAVSLCPIACSREIEGGSVADHHDVEKHSQDEKVGRVSSALAPNATVADAVTSECETGTVKGLSVQLVEELECLRPNTFMKIDNTPGLSLGNSVMPYLQISAAKALVDAQKARGVPMTINSAMRTLAQQYMLYRWSVTGRCAIDLAAKPGMSNHEGAIAVDIEDNAGWRPTLTSNSFSWLGAKDPVHYDFKGNGAADLGGLSVQAFQRLWNRNNPADPIAEDGVYGGATEARLAQTPANGFAKGADCNNLAPNGGTPAATGTEPPGSTTTTLPIIPEATEGGENDTAPSSHGQLSSSRRAGPVPRAEGCSFARAHGPDGSVTALAMGIAAAMVLARRRSARSKSGVLSA